LNHRTDGDFVDPNDQNVVGGPNYHPKRYNQISEPPVDEKENKEEGKEEGKEGAKDESKDKTDKADAKETDEKMLKDADDKAKVEKAAEGDSKKLTEAEQKAKDEKDAIEKAKKEEEEKMERWQGRPLSADGLQHWGDGTKHYLPDNQQVGGVNLYA